MLTCQVGKRKEHGKWLAEKGAALSTDRNLRKVWIHLLVLLPPCPCGKPRHRLNC